MTILIINPGSGPVDDASEAHAVAAMEQFRLDTGAESFARDAQQDGGGRYGFTLVKRDGRGEPRTFAIEMPGRPLDAARYLGPPQDIWDFPRLYVDGSSWVWRYAVSSVRACETRDEG